MRNDELYRELTLLDSYPDKTEFVFFLQELSDINTYGAWLNCELTDEFAKDMSAQEILCLALRAHEVSPLGEWETNCFRVMLREKMRETAEAS